MEYYSAIKMNKLMPFAATRIDLECVILSEVCQTEKEKYYMTFLVCGIYTVIHMNLQNRDRLREETYGCQGKWIIREFGMGMYTLLYLKWVTNKGPLYSTGNSGLCYMAGWM